MPGKTPHVQLRAVVSGPGGTADARRSFTVLERLMTLIGQIEAKETGSADSTWEIQDLQFGSIAVTMTPNRLAENATAELMAELAAWTIDGFSQAEEEETLPQHWPSTAVETGMQLSKCLGLLESDGMLLELLENGRPRRHVVVTRRTADNLRNAMRRRRTSIGSVIGRLESISVHGALKAGIWIDLGGRRVEVQFTRDQKDAVQKALDKRVEVSGQLTRDVHDRPVSIKMRRIELLPEEDVPLSEIAGADPDLTGSMPTAEYLRRLYDAS